MVPLDRETSNTILEVFEEWSHQLEAADFTSLEIELEDEIEEPKP